MDDLIKQVHEARDMPYPDTMNPSACAEALRGIGELFMEGQTEPALLGLAKPINTLENVGKGSAVQLH